MAKNVEKQNLNKNNGNNFNLPPKQHKKVKKNLSKIDQSFFMSEETFQLILLTINRLENIVNTKAEIDQLWSEIKNVIISEMNSLPELPMSNSKKQNRKFKKSNKFWNEELEILWLETCSTEKNYLNFKVRSNSDFPVKNNFRILFKTAQKHFDKKFRHFKRQYKKNEHSDLETSAKFRPAAMWEKLNKLNNPPTARAALEIIREDETISRDLKEILERWFKDISTLFSGLREDPDMAFDDNFCRPRSIERGLTVICFGLCIFLSLYLSLYVCGRQFQA